MLTTLENTVSLINAGKVLLIAASVITCALIVALPVVAWFVDSLDGEGLDGLFGR